MSFGLSYLSFHFNPELTPRFGGAFVERNWEPGAYSFHSNAHWLHFSNRLYMHSIAFLYCSSIQPGFLTWNPFKKTATALVSSTSFRQQIYQRSSVSLVCVFLFTVFTPQYSRLNDLCPWKLQASLPFLLWLYECRSNLICCVFPKWSLHVDNISVCAKDIFFVCIFWVLLLFWAYVSCSRTQLHHMSLLSFPLYVKTFFRRIFLIRWAAIRYNRTFSRSIS